MRLYTRTGDDGTTGLLGGVRVSKQDVRIEAIGAVDELNAALGVARGFAQGSQLEAPLGRIQETLFELGAELASQDDCKSGVTGEIAQLERSMDLHAATLPPLKCFILPGGSPLAAQLHVARAVCRRAERRILALHETQTVCGEARIYINRLSDWLFSAARAANAEAGIDDIPWRRERR